MAKFDTKLFLTITGQGTSPVRALGTAFGMPSCLLNLTDYLISLLPSEVLNSLKGSILDSRDSAKDCNNSLLADIRYALGLTEVPAKNGIIKFISNFSRFGLEYQKGNSMDNVNAFNESLSLINEIGRAYNNIQTTIETFKGIEECINSYTDYLRYTEGAANTRSKLTEEQYNQLLEDTIGAEKRQIQSNNEFIQKANSVIASINRELNARSNDPSREPVFTSDFKSLLSGTDLLYDDALDVSASVTEEIFRLAYSPPRSKVGRFLFSTDGLYFDSQTDGILPALSEIANRELPESKYSWKLEYDPNIGGRGAPVTTQQLKYYMDTILDPSKIDESLRIKPFYDEDVLLQDLVGQKNRRLYDISLEIDELVNQAASQILIDNMKQVILSETSYYNEKINKRKKQIELAVKLPVAYGKGSLYEPGEIPVNDFSYLDGINFNLNVETQRQIIINQSEVSSVVIPLSVKLVEPTFSSDTINLEHLLLAGLGAGAIITNTSGEGAVSAPGLTVNKSVVTDGLIALYNSLKFELTEVSGSFGLFNSYRTGVDYNAQIVGDTSSTFPSGVGIAYLEGITRHSSDDPTSYSSIGSFIRLPDKKEFQDLFYSQKGATIDVWLHMPNLNEAGGGFDSAEASGLYRILLANENTGITTGFDHGTDIHNMKWVNTNETVKGLMIGFTRDRRLTLSLSASNDSADNPAANSCFFIAPTQAYDNSSIGLLFNSNKPCDDGKVYQGLTIPVSSTNSDVSLSSCGEEFCHLSMVFDSTKKIINVYLDGVLINTSKYIDVFGKDRISDIPSLIKTGTFEYESDGPSLDSYFTPWIVGGGYTDGMGTGNFMGGLFGGIISGLKGFVGSLKFYSKPLTGAEVLQNYKANKGFFKNIDLG